MFYQAKVGSHVCLSPTHAFWASKCQNYRIASASCKMHWEDHFRHSPLIILPQTFSYPDVEGWTRTKWWTCLIIPSKMYGRAQAGQDQ